MRMAVAEHRFDNAKRRRAALHPAQRQLTPEYLLAPLRELLGGIELDPCTEPGTVKRERVGPIESSATIERPGGGTSGEISGRSSFHAATRLPIGSTSSLLDPKSVSSTTSSTPFSRLNTASWP
jgi:hypothetical protein